MKSEHLYNYILGIADNSLILGQRLGELCGHGPSLETDIAGTNISLDLIGQTRSYYQYAAKISGENKTEDDIAFLRLERHYKNVLLVEQPNTHFGYVMGRQYLFDVFHLLLDKCVINQHKILLSLVPDLDPAQRRVGDLGQGTLKIEEAFQWIIEWREYFLDPSGDTLATWFEEMGKLCTYLESVKMDTTARTGK